MPDREPYPRVGFVGLGRMGHPMAGRLAAAGVSLVVFDARVDVARAFAIEFGATAAGSLSDVEGDVVITMLPDGHAVEGVVSGAAPGAPRLRDAMRSGATLIDMGSSSPVGTRALGHVLSERGIAMLDAPVSGGVARARAGTLSIMVGGDPDIVRASRPLFALMATQVFEMGPLGAGHAMKALNNMVSAAGLLAAAEALLVGQRFGLDPQRMIDTLNASTGRNNATENKLAQFILSRSFASGFALDLMVKDLAAAIDLAHDTNTPAPLSSRCRELWTMAQSALEPGSDHTAIMRWLESETAR
jgi:3-hydroxyisobutyrate dehydrogenase